MATRGEFGCNQLSALLASQEVFGPNDYSPVCDVWFDETKHLLSSLGDPDKDSIVDLEQSEELEDLSGLGGDLGDTTRSERERKHTQNSNISPLHPSHRPRDLIPRATPKLTP